jgi:MoxR-like ATPase
VKDVQFRRVPTDELIQVEDPRYIPTGLEELLGKYLFKQNLVLKGPKGVGKTLSVQQVAAEVGAPLLRYDCHEETSVRDLVGKAWLDPSGIPVFVLGAITAAIEIANEEGACVLVLEEINTLPPAVQKLINAISDYRREIAIPSMARVFKLREKAQFWLLGTANPGYSGTYQFNEDLRSRFQFIPVPYPKREVEMKILLGRFPEADPTAREKRMAANLVTLAAETRSGEYSASIGYALSPRDLVDVVDQVVMGLGWEDALKMLEGKFDGEGVMNFQARVQSACSINLREIALY